jgi:1-acyl-sn-glycerol-3-phosphate acyltransferase
MNILKTIFARIWALWGLLSFVATFAIIFLPSMASYLFTNHTKGQRYFIWVSKIWMRSWLTLIGCRLKIYGLEHFASNQNFIVVFNHNSMLDIPLSCPFVPGANKTIGKSSLSTIPIFGQFYKRGAVLVNRSDEKSRRKSYEMMKAVLQQNMHMCVYPEGTRNRTDLLLKPFFDGAFKLSVDTRKEIIPCIISGTKEASPIHRSFYLWPTTLRMQFLPPIAPENCNIKELNQKVHQVMLNAIQVTGL